MKILIACEESQAVTIAMRKVGNEAYSCDVIDCSGGHPEWHIRQDVIPLLDGRCRFKTCDGLEHNIPGHWDMIIAFPPCTYLTAASAVRLFSHDGSVKDLERYKKGILAAEFFMRIYHSECDAIAIENPTPLKCFGLPCYDQVIEPYMFGDPWKKRTCLWLRGLKKLEADNIVEPLGLWVGSTSAKRGRGQRFILKSNRDPRIRAKTFPGIARAMSEQWGW